VFSEIEETRRFLLQFLYALVLLATL